MVNEPFCIWLITAVECFWTERWNGESKHLLSYWSKVRKAQRRSYTFNPRHWIFFINLCILVAFKIVDIENSFSCRQWINEYSSPDVIIIIRMSIEHMRKFVHYQFSSRFPVYLSSSLSMYFMDGNFPRAHIPILGNNSMRKVLRLFSCLV